MSNLARIAQEKERLGLLQGQYFKLYDDAPKVNRGGTDVIDLKSHEFSELRGRMDEMNMLGELIDQLVREEKHILDMEQFGAVKNGIGGPNGKPESKGVAERFSKSLAVDQKNDHTRKAMVDFEGNEILEWLGLGAESKTNMTTSAGWAPVTVRDGTVVPKVVRPIQLLDFVRIRNAGESNSYMEETTLTNSAAERTEATGALAESAFALTQRSDTFAAIGHVLPVTQEQMDDVAEVRGYVEDRMPWGVRQRLDNQLVMGDGSTPNLQGLLTVSGIQTQAASTDNKFLAIWKAMAKIRGSAGSGTYGVPDFVLMNIADITTLLSVVDTTGRFMIGNPTESPLLRAWGVPVIQHDGLTATNVIVGDSNWLELRLKKDMIVEWTNTHSTQFAYLLNMMRAYIRVALRIYRAGAFCKVTGF